MSGKRMKMLRKTFEEIAGRKPQGARHTIEEDRSTFINKHGLRQWSHGYEKDSELHFERMVTVDKESEWRKFKRVAQG